MISGLDHWVFRSLYETHILRVKFGLKVGVKTNLPWWF